MADENRRMSEQFGDLEYEYDLLDHLDPIARAGFDPSRVRVGDLDKRGQNTAYYQPVGDIINIGPSQLSSKGTHAHEFRERGINILMKEISDDSLAFRKKYGDELYFQLLDLKIAIEAQDRPQMIEDGEYNKNLAEMISEFYEKHESYNKPTGPYVEGEDVPPFSYNRKTRQPNTAAERLALLKAYADERGLPVRQGMRVITPEEQFRILETDNQSAFREYLQTNPADRVEGAFFRGAFRGDDTVKNRPLFESVDLLRQFAEEQNKKRGIRNPEEYFVVKPREQFAQGGPVMRGIGTLNETARNMTRGPSGVAAYQHLANGGEAQFSMDQFEQDYRNERREALRDSVKSGKTSLPVGILQHGVNRLGEGVSDTVQGIGAFAKSLYNNPQAVAESGAKGLEALYNRVAQGDPMAAMEVAGMVATGGATAAVAKGARLADFATFDPDTSRMFIGDVGAENLEKAGRPVAKKVLQVARQMRMRGASEAEIRAKTNQIIEKEDPSLGGVSSNAAGQLVVEIDDSKMALRSDSAIRRATGGYQNPEGGMYFPADVDNVLKGTVFPKAYPNEASIRIADVSEAVSDSRAGEFEPSTNTLTTYVLNNEVPNVASHELQHYIQFKEKFPRGGSLDDAELGLYGPIADDYDEIANILYTFADEKIPEGVFSLFDNPEIIKKAVAEMLEESGGDKVYAADFAKAEAEGIRNNPRFYLGQLYRAVSGEVEARNVQTRLKMTAAERRATPPEDTEDIPRDQQTIIRRAQGGEVMQGVGSLNETARNMFRGPRGIGAYQQFADGGPVYMSNGGEGSVERIKDGILQTVFDVESNGDFNRWHDNAQNIPETPLTQMTVSEIMGYQGGENGPAAGAGQIKYNTFQYLLDAGTLKPDEVFSPQVQRKAHSKLLDRRGFNEWVQGELSNDGFIQRLAREYAAVPLAQDEQVGDTLRESGKSRYGGSNAHRISLDNMRNVLTSLKSPSMASEAALDEAMYAADYLEPQTMPLFAEPEEAGPDLIDAQTFDSGVGSIMSPTIGEELRQGFRPSFGSQSQQDDFEAMVPQKISMRDKYSTENIAADLVGGKEALEEGIGGLRTPSSLTRKIKLPSGSVYEQGGAPRDDAKRYQDLGYADPRHSQARSVTPNKRKIGYPKTSRLFRRNN